MAELSPGEDPVGRGVDRYHHDAVIDILDDFRDHDLAGLGRLTPAERSAQLRLRQELFLYIDALWNDVTQTGQPAMLAELGGVAAMRSLTSELVAHVAWAENGAQGEQPQARDSVRRWRGLCRPRGGPFGPGRW